MRDNIFNLAEDKSCILAVTPDNGGSWWSTLRPNTPRNFAENPMTWTDAKTALDTIDQSHDFTFEIEFKCVKTNAAFVFASDGLNDFIRVFMSDGTVIVSTALMGTSSGGLTQFSAGSNLTNRHILTVKFTGNAITASVDSEVVYTRENLFRNVIEIGTPCSNAGYVYKISLTDDTTGETVWQASYDELYLFYQPIDFSKNTKSWDSYQTAQLAADYSHDYTFEVTFENTVTNKDASILYRAVGHCMFGVYLYQNGAIGATTCLLYDTTVPEHKYIFRYVNATGNPRLVGKHTIKMTVVGTTITFLLDDVVVQTVSGNNIARSIPENLIVPQSQAGFIYSAKITDDTTNTIIWQAAHNELYNSLPNNPWPSSTPRNFADEPTTFADSCTAQDGIGKDNFTLAVDFTLLRENVHGAINIGCMLCLYYDSTKGYQPGVRILKSDGTKEILYPVGTMHITEDIASIKVIRTGQNVRMVVHARDGSTIRDQTKPLPDGATVTYVSRVTNYSGSISAASIRNDTTGETVWQANDDDLITY